MIYELVSLGNKTLLRLNEAESADHLSALKLLRAWAEVNNWKLAERDSDGDANCFMQVIYFLDDLPEAPKAPPVLTKREREALLGLIRQ